MRKGLTDRGIKIRQSETPIIPIFTYDTMSTFVITKALYDEGVYVNASIPPATPEGEALIRTSYMATLTYDLLDEALEIIDKVYKSHPEIFDKHE
jgi:7-keto-8-aminopelargonate synthetase-like enzyme